MQHNTLGEILSHLRRQAGLTQEELADGICSPVSVSRIENGRQMPSGRVLEQLLERLGTGTYQLCSVYYENECQASLRETLEEVERLLVAGEPAEAQSALERLPMETLDTQNLQHAKLLRAALRMQGGAAEEGGGGTDGVSVSDALMDALRLTKPALDLNDCRGELLSPTEANLLVMLTAVQYMEGKNVEALRLGEEVLFALERSRSRLSEYQVLQINLMHNLSQILLDEHRYQEALNYAKQAEALSIAGTEQFLLPEIELVIAQLLNELGEREESRARMEVLIPYMRLIQKNEMAELAETYLEEHLTNDVSSN